MGRQPNSHIQPDCVLYGGLHWQVVVGSGGLKRLMAQARLQGRTHSVISGASFRSFGAITQTNIEKRGLLTHHSAAACFARLSARGSHAVVVNLGAASFLLLAVSDGAVLVKGDQYFSDSETAQAALQELSESSPNLSARYIEDGEEFLRSLQAHRSLETQLQPIGRRRRWRYVAMLSVLLVTLSVWMLSLGVPKGVSAIDAGQVMPLSEVAGSSYALEAVLAEWYGLSLQVDQWQLSSVNCELRHSRLWTCALQMLRPGKPLKGDVPGIKGWELISQSETELNYRRTVAYSEAGRQSQAQPNHEAVTLQSLWRNYAHAFSRFHSLPPSPAFAPGPDTNQEAPIWLPGSQVFIEGPLRALVLARDAIGGLKNLQLELRVSAEPAMPSPKSQLMFSLSGVQL